MIKDYRECLDLINNYLKLLMDLKFKQFQNGLSKKIYDSLAQEYSNNKDEVSLVGRLVDMINNSVYKNIKLYAQKIHGAKSFVEFNYRSTLTTKEIADMVVISVASSQREIVFQKITFIQNKVGKNKNWDIDDEQLFLLKNFPTFSGRKGIFKSFSDEQITFSNNTKCLGSYGLFMDPGEMVFLSAPLLSELVINNKIEIKNIRLPEKIDTLRNSDSFFQFILFNDLFPGLLPRYLEGFGFITPFLSNKPFPFLNNSIFARDVYDFVQDWTRFNIGEPTYAFGKVINPTLYEFTNFLLKTTGIKNNVNLPLEGTEGEFDSGMALFVMHIDIGELR